MAIENHVDPRTRKPYLLATGKVGAVYINDLKEIKEYPGPKAIWRPTKSVKIVVDGAAISLGLSEKDVVRAKDADGNYHDVVKGVEVSVEVEENGEYKGVKQYQAKTSGITITDLSGAEASGSQQARNAPAAQSQSFKPKDTSGIRTGHSVNGAFAYLLGNGLDFDYEADGITTRIAKIVNDVTETVIAAYKAKNPNMSEYDVGAAAGHAVLNACRIIPETDETEFADVLTTTANAILYNIIPAVTEYVKKGQEAKPVKVSPPAAKKAVSKAKPVVKAPPKEEPEQDERPVTGFDDLDDDIPFN